MINDKIEINQLKKEQEKNKNQPMLTFETSDFGYKSKTNPIKGTRKK